MTLDDLEKIYDDAYEDRARLEFPTPEMKRAMHSAGIKAVVLALRPKLELWFHAIDDDVTVDRAENFARDFIDEILCAASASPEVKAAGGPTREDGRVVTPTAPSSAANFISVTETALRSDNAKLNDLCLKLRAERDAAIKEVGVWARRAGFVSGTAEVTAAAASQVCEWTFKAGGWEYDLFDTSCGEKPVKSFAAILKRCSRCGRPIKFTEAK